MVTDVKALKTRVTQEIDRLRPEAESIAAEIHGYAETGWHTPKSASALIGYLERHGLEVEKGVADLECSFRASIPGRQGQRTAIALLAEFDALVGQGHACGHNLIGTVATTAGIALSRVLGDVPGNIYVMGTPFEEGGGGKIFMVEKGIFNEIDASIQFHGSNRIGAGSPNIAATEMNYQFFGKPAHSGGSPHLGINAADAAMLTFAGANALRQHIRSDARIHGIITEGGKAPNTVPDYSAIKMMVRAADQKYLLALRERVDNCAKAGALATGCRIEIEHGPVFAERVVLPLYSEVVKENMTFLGVPAPTDDPQTFASDDGGNVSYAVPHMNFNLPLDAQLSQPHTAAFAEAANSDTGRQAMITAAKIMACTVIDLLTDPARLEEITKQQKEYVARRLG